VTVSQKSDPGAGETAVVGYSFLVCTRAWLEKNRRRKNTNQTLAALRRVNNEMYSNLDGNVNVLIAANCVVW